MRKKKIIVIGGGTGAFVVLAGLSQYPLDLTAIVTVADSGGSTGRLRSEFGFLPVGDMRQCLAALASEAGDGYIRKLLLYRFSKGKGLVGHNLGNLLLTALTDLTSSEPKALEIAAKIFRLQGRILPITLKNIQLVAYYADGKKVKGEHEIDEPRHNGGLHIVKLKTEPKAMIYEEARKEILKGDLIILGPGDLYTSIFPNLIIGGSRKALRQTRAKIIYIVNLMNRYSQTYGFTAQDYVRELKKYLGRNPDYIFLNKKKIPPKILELYHKEKGFPVKDDLTNGRYFKIIRRDFLAPGIVVKSKGDQLERSYLRHSSPKLARAITSLLK